MAPRTTVTEKLGAWAQAFEAIERSLTPPGMREMAELAQPQGAPNEIALGVEMARIVHRNGRTAAIAAAMLVQSGVSRPIIDDDGETA
jgi:hypothetical protein